MRTEEQDYAAAYNAHEGAESAALGALHSFLDTQSVEALAVLCDPQWGWTQRGWMSETIIEYADQVLNTKLDALVSA